MIILIFLGVFVICNVGLLMFAKHQFGKTQNEELEYTRKKLNNRKSKF